MEHNRIIFYIIILSVHYVQCISITYDTEHNVLKKFFLHTTNFIFFI